MTVPGERPLSVWRIRDGKPGHENQTLGLCRALEALVPCTRYDIGASQRLQPLLGWLSRRYAPGEALPDPDLIIGAGHGTHLHLLAARRARGGRIIVLMRPSLPPNWFDLCLVPEHDGYHGGGRILQTQGVLNAMSSEGEHDPDRVLILVGGTSPHHKWAAQHLIHQIERLIHHRPALRYLLTTSRRTPAGFVDQLRQRAIANLEIVPCEATEPGWVGVQLARSASAWVTADSVSMVYESLTAGVAVGILDLPRVSESRISRGLDELLGQGWVVPFDDQGHYLDRLRRVEGFNEAQRCAHWVTEWLKQN